MNEFDISLPKPPSFFRIVLFGTLGLLLVECSLLLNWYSGIILLFNLTLIYGIFLFLIQFWSSKGSRGRSFYLASSVIYGLVLWRISWKLYAFDDYSTGTLLLSASLIGWTAIGLTLYRRWPFPQFRLILILVLLLWAGGFYFNVLHSPMRVTNLASNTLFRPRFVSWLPNGNAFYINEDDEWNKQGKLHRFNIDPTDKKYQEFSGIVSQAQVSPDSKTLAVIIEDKHRHYHLMIKDLGDETLQKVYSTRHGIYFPFRNTQSPWSPNSGRALLSVMGKGTADLWVYDRSNQKVQHIANGLSTNRVFWIDDERIGIPREHAQSSRGPPQFDRLDVYSTKNSRLVETRPLGDLYDSLYAYNHSRKMILKKGDWGKFLADLDFEHAEPLPTKNLKYLEVAFSPRGRRLAFAKNKSQEKAAFIQSPVKFNFKGLTSLGGCELKIYDSEDQQTKTVFKSRTGSIASITWSPNGAWVAFSLRTSSWLSYGASVNIVSPDTGIQYKIAAQHPTLIVDFYRRLGRKHLYWQPGSEQLLFWNTIGNEGDCTYSLVQCSTKA